MYSLTVTPPYAALLALLFVILSVSVIRARRRARIAIGAGGDPLLERRMRAQANFAEYAPLALLLLTLAELRGAPGPLLHGLCLSLLLGRSLHAWGVSQPREDLRFRVAGMGLTFATLLITALILLLGPLMR